MVLMNGILALIVIAAIVLFGRVLFGATVSPSNETQNDDNLF